MTTQEPMQTNEKEPTQEQLQKFWEWCGFRNTKDVIGVADKNKYYYPDSQRLWYLPALDLNNLFKYAVPKLEYCGLVWNKEGGHGARVILKKLGVEETNPAQPKHNERPELALFWAIWEVVK